MEKAGEIGFIIAILFVALVSGAVLLDYSPLKGNEVTQPSKETDGEITACGEATWDVTSASVSTASLEADSYSGQMQVTWFYVDRAPVQTTVDMDSNEAEASNQVENGQLSSATAVPLDCPDASPASYSP